MKVHQEFHEPEHVKDRQPYRVVIESKDGTTIQIVEQMDGVFSVSTSHFRTMVIEPIAMNAVVIKAVR